MSVIKSKRTLSRTEYAMSFVKMYNVICRSFYEIPKRRKFVCEPIINDLNDIHIMVMQIFDAYLKNDFKDLSKQEQAELIISKINNMQKSFIAMWNVVDFTLDKMINIADCINKEIYLIADYGGIQHIDAKRMYILDRKVVNEMEFIGNMAKLHRTIYQKSMSLRQSVRKSRGTLLMDLADSALYHICEANLNYPTSKEIFLIRERHLSIAMSNLKSMNEPLFAIFNLADYKNETMFEISEMIDTEMRLLSGLMKSDRNRFANLQ